MSAAASFIVTADALPDGDHVAPGLEVVRLTEALRRSGLRSRAKRLVRLED